MPATPRTFKFEKWQLEASSEEEYHAARKARIEEEYGGLSEPIIGRDALFEMEDPDWILTDMIQQFGLTIIHGDPGSGKSLIAMDWAYSLAHEDTDGWLGKHRDGLMAPLYLFTEGLHGLKGRTLAWERERGLTAPDIVFVRDPVILNPNNGSSEQLSALERLYVKQERNILFIDTLANTFGGNENQQEDANRYLHTVRRFQKYGPVVLVHHNTKAGDEYRGSSVFRGAADTMVGVTMSEHGVMDLKITKQKDGDPRRGNMTLKLREHSWVTGRIERNSVALAKADPGPVTKPMTAKQRELYEVVLEHGDKVQASVIAGAVGTSVSNLKRMVGAMDTLEYFSGDGNTPAYVGVVQEDEPADL